MVRSPPDSWQALQQSAATILREAGFVAEVEKSRPHARGAVALDVYAELPLNGHVLTLACECKYWRSAVPQAVVQTFRSVLSDTGIDAGYIVSAAGFQSGAREAATHTNIRLVDWDQFVRTFSPDGPPLAPGLRAAAEIVGGDIQYHSPEGSAFPWATRTLITSGSIRRTATGVLEVKLATMVPIPAIQAWNDRIGFSGFTVTAQTGFLSTDASAPTMLSGSMEFETPAGMQGLHPMTGEKITMPVAIRCKLDVTAECFFASHQGTGTWVIVPTFDGTRLPMNLTGSFSMRAL
jgi:hypothetical protein